MAFLEWVIVHKACESGDEGAIFFFLFSLPEATALILFPLLDAAWETSRLGFYMGFIIVVAEF